MLNHFLYQMKRIILAAILLALLLVESKAQMVQNVDAFKFKQLISSEDAILLDVRTLEEYSRAHIQGSTNINIADPEFTSKINLLQKDKTILIHCLSGSRSSACANYLNQMGFKIIYTLKQGLMEWNHQGYALEKSDQVIASTSTAYTEQSFARLLTGNKLVLVDFHAVWCAPCKAMNPIIDKLAIDYKGKATIEKIDIEANKQIANVYQVQSVPGFVLFKQGIKVWSHNGKISYNDFVAVIKKYL